MNRGIPATLEHFDGGARPNERRTAADVSNATEAMITLLNVLEVDTAPEVSTLIDPLCYALNCLRTVDYLVPNLKDREKLVNWSSQLSALRAVDVISEDQRRQMLLDAESLYREFKFRMNLK